jgi:DNA polymerase type B, organellar and viral
MIVVDTEDNSPELLAAGRSGFEKQVTHIAAICENGKRFHNTGNPLEFLKWCHQQGKHEIWGFNTAYDLGNLCNTPSKLRFDDFDVTMVKGRFIKGTTQGLNFLDAHNLSGPGTLGDLGASMDLPKFGYPYTQKQQTQFSTDRLREWKEYDKEGSAKFNDSRYFFRDCEIPMKFLKFVREQCLDMGIEKVPATLGSLCVKAFYANGGENWHEASEETASSLRGARVELFNQGGEGRIAYTDINSLYPHCLTMLFPVCMEKLSDLEGYGVAKCDVSVPLNSFVAPLPWRDEDGRLIFPVGKLSGVWTIHELRNAMKHGCKIKKVEWILGSREGKPFYRDYITETYQKRLQAKTPAENLFWKLLMNNLYGRLAISGEISRSMLLTEDNWWDDEGIPYGRKILSSHKMPLPDFTNYLHASYVLSYARIVLFKYLKTVDPQNLIYCDTDSVIFFCRDEIPFPVGKDLGQMKLEAWGKRMIPLLPKTYTFDQTYKAKGVPKKHAQQFIEKGFAEYETPFKMRESIRFFDTNNARKLSVWRKVQKIRQSKYDRKRVKGDFYLPKVVKCWQS